MYGMAWNGFQLSVLVEFLTMQMRTCFHALSRAPFLLLVLPNSNVLAFLLSYYIILYYHSLIIRNLFLNKKQKGSGLGGEGGELEERKTIIRLYHVRKRKKERLLLL